MPRTMKLAPSAAVWPSCAGAAGGRELVCSDDVLGAEVAGAEAVGAAEDARDFGQLDLRAGRQYPARPCDERGADVAAQRVVGAQRFVGALQDDDVLLAAQRLNDGGLREGRMTLTWMEPTVAPRVSRR